jgi:hypothetical protein
MTWHNFDIEKLSRWLVPTFQRRVNTVLWLRALLAPLDWLKSDILYRMQHDCRVIYMEKVLNEKFTIPGYDPDDHENTKVIYIDDGNVPEGIWLNKSNNPDKIFLGTQYLNTSGYYEANYSDFIVYAPTIMQAMEMKLRYYINYYKLAGKAYKIEYF